MKGRRPVDFALEGVHQADLFAGELLEPGMHIIGPAIVETKGTTVVLHPRNELAVDGYGNLVISIEGA
jgi:N-methylhydantoinase A